MRVCVHPVPVIARGAGTHLVLVAGFLVGLIIPRSLGHHFAQRIEDLVTCIFIPLYLWVSFSIVSGGLGFRSTDGYPH